MTVRRAALATVALLAALGAAPAHAWGAKGHHVVGLVAERFLTGDARRELYRLAGDEGLDELGTYLDRERERLRHEWPGSDRWHYDNRPVCEPATPFAARCAQGDCPTAAYERALAALKDGAAPRERRLDALRVVVHLVADAHQPLHAADHDDRGGNDVEVERGPRDEPRSLHGLWDRELVEAAARGASNRRFAADLVRDYGGDPGALERGRFVDWLQESYDIGRRFGYARLPGFACGRASPAHVTLADDYRMEAARIVRERLARAGVRLAGVLNAALTPAR